MILQIRRTRLGIEPSAGIMPLDQRVTYYVLCTCYIKILRLFYVQLLKHRLLFVNNPFPL